MNAYRAHNEYLQAAQDTIDGRAAEYDVFRRVTRAMETAMALPENSFERKRELIIAVSDNTRLWNTLAADLQADHNALPLNLKSNLLSLARFMRAQAQPVLDGASSLRDLIDINKSIMAGLKEYGRHTGESHGGA